MAKIIILAVICFILGACGLYAFLYFYFARGNKKNKHAKNETESDKVKKAMGTLNLILVMIGAFLLIFTVAMIIIFCVKGSTPDTLIACVFGVCGTECGAMAWIRTSKEKYKEIVKEAADDADTDSNG